MLQIVIPVGTSTSVGTGIVTYSGLVSTLGLWLNRSDLGDKIPVFITLLEARLNRILRVPEMEEVTTLSVSEGDTTAALPTDFREARHLYEDTTPQRQILATSLSQLRSIPESSGTVELFAVSGGNMYFSPTPSDDASFVLHYYKEIPALSSDNETNWLIAAHPDVYLYGALVMAEAFLWNDERLPLWKSAWDEALSELIGQGSTKRHGGGPLAPRTGW